MSIKKVFIVSFFISILISFGTLKCQIDTSVSYLKMIEMKSGIILFANIVAEDSSSMLIKKLSGQNFQLKKQDILKIIHEWNKIKQNYIQINLIDGSNFAGRVENYKDSCFVVLNRSDIEMKIPGKKISGFKNLTGSTNSITTRSFDPNRTRLFFVPTARSLKSGEGYFSDYMVFFPFLAFGITDFASISGGISLIPNIEFVNQLLYGNLKFTLHEGEIVSVGTGVLYTNITNNSGGILYGIVTVGPSDEALTFGLGEGFTGENGFSDYPVLVIGGEIQVSNSIKLLSENWIPTDGNQAIISFGIRFFGKHIAGDFGLLTFSSLNKSKGFPFIPWLSFTYNFGN